MTLINISKRKKIIVSIIAFFFIFLGYYLAVYKSFSYQSNNQTIGNVLMIISIIIFPMLWYDAGENPSVKSKIFLIPNVFIAIGIVIGVISLRDNYLKNEINNYGTKVIGKVSGFEIETHRRGKTDYATFIYEFENKRFVQRIENYDNEYKLNQNLNIKISKRNPEMFEIIENEK